MLLLVGNRTSGLDSDRVQNKVLDMENYDRGEKLGEGAWGVVTSAVSYD